MIEYIKATDWEFIRSMLLIMILPLVVIALPILYFGEAPLNVWFGVGGITLVLIGMIFGMEKTGR